MSDPHAHATPATHPAPAPDKPLTFVMNLIGGGLFGMLAGLVVGVLAHNITTGVAGGLAAGLALGAILGATQKQTAVSAAPDVEAH